MALGGKWEKRMHYWTKQLGNLQHEIGVAPRLLAQLNISVPEAQMATLVRASFAHLFRMSSFDVRTTPQLCAAPPQLQALASLAEAASADSLDDLDTTLKHLRAAQVHAPNSALIHFKLGAVLGQLGLRAGKRELMQEAELECRLAYKIDPDFGNARNEVGVILANTRRHAEADAAFAEAAPYCRADAHHWENRADNYIAMGRLEDAASAYREAIACSKDGEHTLAMARLAAVLIKLGRRREARQVGNRVHHRVDFDPCENADMVLDFWRTNPFLV